MNHCKVEWSKIFVEWEVSKIVIDIEEEGIFEILWWFNIGYPIEFIYIILIVKKIFEFATYL